MFLHNKFIIKKNINLSNFNANNVVHTNTIYYVNSSLYYIDLFNFYINKETKYSFNIFEFSSLIFLSNFNTSNTINTYECYVLWMLKLIMQLI